MRRSPSRLCQGDKAQLVTDPEKYKKPCWLISKHILSLPRKTRYIEEFC
jgi:hypothetical protein